MPAEKRRTIYKKMILSVFFGMFWGGWAFLCNKTFGMSIAAKAMITQGIFSFIATLFFTGTVDFLFSKIQTIHSKIMWSLIFPLTTMLLILTTTHHAIGTRHIYRTITPPLIFMLIYCTQKIVRHVYTKTIK